MMKFNQLNKIFNALKENQINVSKTTYKERIFKLKKLSKALLDYQSRCRRFGGLTPINQDQLEHS